MVDNEHCGTINNPRNLQLKVEGKLGSRAWCTIRNSSSSSSLPSKNFILSLHFFWLMITSLAAVFFAPLQVWWCCHKAGDTYCRKNLFVVECKLQSEKFRFNTKKYEIKELFDPELSFRNTISVGINWEFPNVITIYQCSVIFRNCSRQKWTTNSCASIFHFEQFRLVR